MKRPTGSDIDLRAVERETGFGWGWFASLGLALVTLGLLAFLNLPKAATVSLYAVGIFMLTGAFAKLGTLLLVPRRRGIGHLALSAVLYGAAGVLVIVNPTLAAKPLALMLAFALIFSGVMRIWLSIVMPSLAGWGWIAASGTLSLAAGIVFIAGWPADTVWFLGTVLVIDLSFQGAMTIAFALALRAITE